MARTSLSLPFSGVRLRHWRERAGLTQQALADVCGLSRFQISRWETGDARPEPGSLHPLVRGLSGALKDAGQTSSFTLADLLDTAGCRDVLPAPVTRCQCSPRIGWVERAPGFDVLLTRWLARREISADDLAALTGITLADSPPVQESAAAGLIWDLRRPTADQIEHVHNVAGSMREPGR